MDGDRRLRRAPSRPDHGTTSMQGAPAPRGWRLYGGFTAWLAVPIVALWVVLTVLAVRALPGLSVDSGGVVQLVPGDASALGAQQAETRDFGFPLSAQAVVVQRNPAGLSQDAQKRVVDRAQAQDAAAREHRAAPMAAIPLVNDIPLGTPAHERSTTALTYLAFDPGMSTTAVDSKAREYMSHIDQPSDALVGLTGPVPAQFDEGNKVESSLGLVELVSVLVVVAIIVVTFRSPFAPIVPLAAAAIAYELAVHVIGWGAQHFGMSVPVELRPVLVVLLLAVVTDYSVFFLSGQRRRLLGGVRPLAGMRDTSARVSPIVLGAGLTVAAGTFALVASGLDFFHALGPGLAVTVLVGTVVCVTFVPALLAILGPLAFWPSLQRSPLLNAGDPAARRAAEVEAAGPRRALTRLVTRRGGAAAMVVLSLAVLAACASGLHGARLGVGLISGLPSDLGARRAADAAGAGFVPGAVGPSTLLLEGQRLDGRQAALAALEQEIRSQPGVAAVVGAAESIPDSYRGLFVSQDGNAARAIVVLDSDPYDSPAVDAMRTLEQRTPALLARAGLGDIRAQWAGVTPLAVDTVDRTLADVWRIAGAAAVLILVVLVVFLRSLVAPVLLLGASALALAAPLGLAAYVFPSGDGNPGLAFFVPVAAGVLLLSLGSDYSVFVVGRIWEEARTRPLREAMVVALPAASRSIGVAALALAASFGALSLVPVAPFRQLSFIVAVGVAIDAFLVRSLLLPALLTLAGRAAFWPGKRSRAGYAEVVGRRADVPAAAAAPTAWE